jgi:hypothetical protein
MGSDRSRVTSSARGLAMIAIGALLAMTVIMALPSARAQAAGQWTTGMLTNNTVDDTTPRLSSTHFVWAQKTGPSKWDIKLLNLATGAAKTIATSLAADNTFGPTLTIAGDYVTMFCGYTDNHSVRLYKISTGGTRVVVPPASHHPSIEYELKSVVGTDGSYVVAVMNDGDDEIMAYDIRGGDWEAITENEDIADRDCALDRGRVVWESTAADGDRTIWFCDLASGSRRAIAGVDSGYYVHTSPRISKDWIGYFDPEKGSVCLYRLADGLALHPSQFSSTRLLLTDDYAFSAGGTSGTDLYAFDLKTLQQTRVTSDAAYEWVLVAEAGRVVYTARENSGDILVDLMVVDLKVTPLRPHRLAQQVNMAPYYSADAGPDASICGNVIAVGLEDGTDAEIGWAVWKETTGSTGFTDVPGGHPYAEAIQGLFAKGIVSGYSTTTFGVNDPVIRQQFAKMITLTLELPVNEADFPDAAVPFTDLGADDPTQLYPHEYVAVCALAGITQGKTATTFAPYANITRAQVISMVVRAAEAQAPGGLSAPPAGWSGQLSYTDPVHGVNIKKAEYHGLLAGIESSTGTLSGWGVHGNATRGEVAQMLWNLLKEFE